MYIAEQATLRVRKIRQSRNGPFVVGELSTEIGDFKVKDAILEQFEEGEYDVTAWVSEIFLAQYISYGKAITEMRARLHDIAVLKEGQHTADYEPLEPDPLDEPEPIVLEPAPAPEPESKPAAAPADADDDAEGDIEDGLYDEEILEAIEGGQPVKLDPSIDRARLRQQTAGLKARGYRFDSKSQTWYRK